MGLSVNNIMSSVIYGKNPEPLKNELKSDQKSEQAKPSSVLGEAGAVYADDKERKENEDMLRKMQMSGTKLESLGAYFKAMQEALIDSGSDGVMAYRRTGNLINNGTDYMSTSEYEEKEESKCLVKDLSDSLEESQKALKEKQAEKKDKDKKADKKEPIAEETEENNKQSKEAGSIEDTVLASKENKEPDIFNNIKNREKNGGDEIKGAEKNILGNSVDIML